MEEWHSRNCGICFMDEGKSVRGQIDSCDHYFCFVCIMEWGKIESKCPLCKRRFSSIRRPPKDGFFHRERLVIVPKRDQVSDCYGNGSSGPSDPYALVQCSVCQGTTDESFLLLCDLCDAGSHTFCVGMGHTIPDGDWFCHDCAVLRNEHDNADSGIDTETVFGGEMVVEKKEHEGNNVEAANEIVHAGGVSQEVVAYSGSEHGTVEPAIDIVNTRGGQSATEDSLSDIKSDLYRNTEEMPGDPPLALFEIVSSNPRPRNSLFRSRDSSLVSPRREIVGLEDAASLNRRRDQNTADNSKMGARTLQHCRDVQDRIQAIREHWSALQNSSLSFSSISVEPGVTCYKKRKFEKVSQDRPGHHLISQDSLSCDSNNVEKAWKMMKSAKSMLQKSKRASHVCQSSKNPCEEGSTSKQSTNTNLSLHNAERQQPENRPVTSVCCNQVTALTGGLYERHGGNVSIGLTQSLMSGNRMIQTQGDVCNVKRATLIGKSVRGASSSVSNKQGGLSSVHFTGSAPRTSYPPTGEADVDSSYNKIDSPKGNGHVKIEAKQYDHAKSEIQHLVKLNLKSLSREKRLEHDAFKKVARHATHTVLAACGLEPTKSGVRFHPISKVCTHGENRQVRKSGLMPDSCQECFYAFVNDVVASIFRKK